MDGRAIYPSMKVYFLSNELVITLVDESFEYVEFMKPNAI